MNPTRIKLGIIGGGQLSRMMAFEAQKMGIYIEALDPDPKCPASYVANSLIVSDFYNEEHLAKIFHNNDFITYDIEHINAEALKKLYDKEPKIFPSPYILEQIQDKLLQKKIFERAKVPAPAYRKLDKNEIENFESDIYPVVQKSRKGGYDGRGVFVLKSPADKANMLKTDSLIEEYIDFEKELAIMAARDKEGNIKLYPVVEMIFDDRVNICDITSAPARVSEKVVKEVNSIAEAIVENLDGVGIFGIELFLTGDEKVYVNEIAPRPHNSGHYTIEACKTSQFEQHIRAVCGLPLGSADLVIPAVMANILGDESHTGKPLITGLKEALQIEGLYFHYYCKSSTKPFRKMGHITVVDNSVDSAFKKVSQAKNIIKVISEK
ncbi:phosphoribosylaminoimidazole carboxylase, atpase subunit [Melioribacter roseus P3M-2]|uniref:N5-carboxyaminoimidazole ribonucleotide synthase n=1 Tax=Melioribacter roseus (strain DSM 23840 / JCM 17771 / VKM B-2668 / P3M-2) TaxID=1191523 RepID=I7A7J7_MELRP|nr:5-(carboxyamino)imidazole ribonucleotide synthase [Melioribacter roseus]AFN75846.1 phosphoribosylaminoimidazole carboxylase, atpase subunit [Melioribacter roseus P3M-2]